MNWRRPLFLIIGRLNPSVWLHLHKQQKQETVASHQMDSDSICSALIENDILQLDKGIINFSQRLKRSLAAGFFSKGH